MAFSMDETDIHILSLLQPNAFLTNNELAKKRFKPMKRIDAPKALKLIKHT